MTTETPAVPKAPTKKEQAAIDKAAATAMEAEDKAAKETAAKEATAAKTAKVEQNGVTRPASGKTLLVWTVADQMSADLKKPVDRKALTDVLLAEPHLLVVGTIHTQYGKWRKFHGLVTEKAAPVEKPAKPAAEQEAA